MKTGIIVIGIFGLALSACGGGGVNENLPENLPEPFSVAPDGTVVAAARAAANLPRSGHVTQSSATKAHGITGDTAVTAFDGSHVTLTVFQSAGGRLRLDSRTDAVPGQFAPETLPAPGHGARDWNMARRTDESTTFGRVTVFWANEDPGNYLAGGYWMHVTGDLADPSDTVVGVGAFVDGPVLHNTPQFPDIGTASYVGPATGLYAYRHGGGHGDIPDGAVTVGEYEGMATLTADFGQMTISGCVGCREPVRVSGLMMPPTGAGRGRVLDGQESGIRMHLGPASIDADGAFRNSDVRIEFLDPGRTASRQSGAWGGDFPGIRGTHAPHLVAGTTGLEWEEADGSRGAVIGTFVGATR